MPPGDWVAEIVVVPIATPMMTLFSTLAIAGFEVAYVHLPGELEVGLVIADSFWPTSIWTGARVPIVGVVPRIFTLNVLLADNQKSDAPCVIVIIADPASPK